MKVKNDCKTPSSLNKEHIENTKENNLPQQQKVYEKNPEKGKKFHVTPFVAFHPSTTTDNFFNIFIHSY